MKALVVLSGGQDSVTCLGVALASYPEVEAIIFNYGQKHIVEINCATNLCKRIGVPYQVVEVPALKAFNDSALVSGGNVNEEHDHKEGLPASFVPARNATFLTLAHGYAQKIGADAIYTGVCQTDYSGYPDCREVFINAIATALNIGYETKIATFTPLMHLTKAETFALAEKYNMLEYVIEDSHTCYNGDHNTKHEWGYGCDKCPACHLRRRGWEEYQGQLDAEEHF